MRVEAVNTDYQSKISQTSYSNGTESARMGSTRTMQKNMNTEKNTRKNIGQEDSENTNKLNNQEEKEKTIEAIDQANKHLRIYNRRLEYEIHDATNHVMVKVINAEDDKVIREIPSEKILDMIGRIWDVAGILVDEKR